MGDEPPAERLARIGRAIDDLAADSLSGGPGRDAHAFGESGAQQAAGEGCPADSGRIADRLARLWAMLAELDPELARRVRRYRGEDG